MYRDGLGGVRRKVMSDKELVSMGSKSFEDLKKINEYGAEYWSAREIQPLLGYTQWRRFEDAVKRAITSCKSSGNEPTHHFANAGKPIAGGTKRGRTRRTGKSEIPVDGKRSKDSLKFIISTEVVWTAGRCIQRYSIVTSLLTSVLREWRLLYDNRS